MFKSIKKRFGYSDNEWRWILYDVANSVFVLTVMTTLFALILGSYLEGESIGIPNVVNEGDGANATVFFTALANLIYSLIIACLAPILGTMSDYIGLKKKMFVFFILLGILGSVGLMIGISYVYVIISFIVAMIGFAGANIFYDAMLPDVTEEKNYHRISSHGFAWGYIGSVVPYLIFMIPFFLVFLKVISFITPLEAMSFAIGACSVWWFTVSMPLITKVKCTNGIPREKKMIRSSFRRMFATVKDMFKTNRNILLFLIAYSFYIDVVNSIITLAVAMATDIGLGQVESLLLIIVIQFIAFPFAIMFAGLVKKFGAKNMIFTALAIYAIIMVLVGLFLSEHKFLIWVVGFLVALVQGGIQGVSRSMFGTLITDKSKAGEYFGFFNVFGKFATVTGPLAIVGGIYFFGDAVSATTSILFLIPSMTIGTFLLIFVKEKKAI